MSRGLNLRRGSNMVVSTKNRIQHFKILAGAQLKRVLADWRRGSTSLNSDSENKNGMC